MFLVINGGMQTKIRKEKRRSSFPATFTATVSAQGFRSGDGPGVNFAVKKGFP